MTSRSTTARRSNRPGRDARDRSLYVNVAFALAIVVGLIFLIAAAVSTYAGSHFAEVGKVNDQSISQDQLTNRGLVDAFRINAAEAQIRDQNQLGHLTDAEAQSRLSVLEQQRQSLSSSTLDELIDAALQGQLAAKMGITVGDAQIDQRLVDEATQKEQRHVSLITITPQAAAGATAPTDAEKAKAKAAADQALADIKGGKSFEEVAKSVSQDAYASGGGDVGWILADDTTLDPALVSAVFALPQAGLTDVVSAADGSYLIGRASEISPASVDPDWTSKIKDAGVPTDAYREAVRADLVRDALTKKITADATEQPSVQRQVSEIFISSSDYQGPGDEVKVRHILYTPDNADPSTGSPLPSDDASWAAAQAKAQATYDKLKAYVGNPTELEAQFAALAKTDSMDTSSGASGGELGWFSRGQLDTGFGDAIFKDGLKKDDLIGPVKSQYGWHVILYEGRRPPPDGRLAGVQVQANAPGADFAAIAKANSDGSDAADGGDLGWVARDQLDAEREKAIFAAPIGKVSDPLKTSSGYYLFLVRDEQTRLPDGTQLDTLKSSAFDNWYAAQKAAATISPDLSAGSS